jgi:hypothetical protein
VTNLRKIEAAEYDLPDFLSAQASHLLKHILVRDPEQRLAIDQIWQHPWVAAGHEGPMHCDLLLCEDVHRRCLQRLQGLGTDASLVEQQLDAMELTRATACYHLLYDTIVEEDKQKASEDEIRRLIAALPTNTGPSTGRSPFLFGKPQPAGMPTVPGPVRRCLGPTVTE